MSALFLVFVVCFLAKHSCAFSPRSYVSPKNTWREPSSFDRKWRCHMLWAKSDYGDILSLPDDRVVEAIHSFSGKRVTAADAAAAAGVSLEEAKVGLIALAAVLGSEDGTALEVDGNGEVAYSFPPDVRKSLRKVSRSARWRARWRDSIKPAAGKVGRTLFGVGLVANVVVVWTMIAALSSASSSSSDDRGGGSRRPSSRSSSSGQGFSFALNALDLTNMLRFSDRSRYYDRALKGQAPPEMGTLEAVYSFVFGDGDPNQGLDEQQLAAAADVIRTAGGVVAAEEIAPWLLEPPPLPLLSGVEGVSGFGFRDTTRGTTFISDSSTTVDEQWLLPVVTALGGVPEVTEDGDIVYVFEDILSTSQEGPIGESSLLDARSSTGSSTPSFSQALLKSRQQQVPVRENGFSGGGGGGGTVSAGDMQVSGAEKKGESVLEEQVVPFSNAPKGALALAAGLGAADLVGVLVLGRTLAVRGLFPAFKGAFWPLFAYAVGVNAAPLARDVRRRRNNVAIEERNQRRAGWRQRVSGAQSAAAAAVAAAEKEAKAAEIAAAARAAAEAEAAAWEAAAAAATAELASGDSGAQQQAAVPPPPRDEKSLAEGLLLQPAVQEFLVSGSPADAMLARKILGAREWRKRVRLNIRRFGFKDGDDGTGLNTGDAPTEPSILFNSAEDLAGSAAAIEATRSELSEFDQRLEKPS
eukprot:CAMPEP_0171936918 /NCGR_PEP_ID=MMETSP0993-20121228/34163_1 /TAXON_ID=483369 /ORGANISM="non described non described, Strain CCMP2098" /LENGTH=695 /DNA_ID=CAMNT_0012578171 /DNA_START=21 /DNA_END=2108 /DNA_ORIENTATION=+